MPDRAEPALAAMPLDNSAPAARRSGYRWVVRFGLVFLATTINYVDRQVLSLLEPDLRDKYHLFSYTQYGYIGMVFGIAYALGQLGAGPWLDRVGVRLGYAVALFFWSLCSIFNALVTGAWGFGIMRSALGVSESPNFPAAIKTLGEWFPQRERATAMGVVNAGSNVGAVLAPALVPWLTLTYGWQSAFVGTGLLGLLWLALWIPLYRPPEQHARVSPAELAYIRSDPPEPTGKVPWRTLLTYKQAWAFCLGKFFTDPIWMFWMSLTADFLHNRHHLDLNTLGWPLVVVFLLADVGSIGGGWASSFLLKRGWSVAAARKGTMFVCCLAVAPVVFAGEVQGLWSAVLLLGLATAAHQGWSANLYTLVADTFPRRVTASVAGLGGMMGYFGVALYLGISGHILEWTHGVYTIPFIIAAAAYLVAMACVHFLTPGLKRVTIDEPQGFPIVTSNPH